MGLREPFTCLPTRADLFARATLHLSDAPEEQCDLHQTPCLGMRHHCLIPPNPFRVFGYLLSPGVKCWRVDSNDHQDNESENINANERDKRQKPPPVAKLITKERLARCGEFCLLKHCCFDLLSLCHSQFLPRCGDKVTYLGLILLYHSPLCEILHDRGRIAPSPPARGRRTT